ncbi:hypothetical protein DFA_12302 [Cavenderia fasciculata]|uniref:Uncharacterized protein n=1 Tax=Cavenderia fasciculata TaxID=261658 RepID=F4QD55_CACFS|nr:uncharacterized protein DFA_12302 [Cavenderia fasciculata]EGG14526.1 hypothetical protein DFA_12302 [Cavenderia fasciculata]|eukprot:XP_004353955.1 hypothetical protein DFA_12302 [Cavenderia fasciculata]
MERIKYLEYEGYEAHDDVHPYDWRKLANNINIEETYDSIESIDNDISWINNDTRLETVVKRLKEIYPTLKRHSSPAPSVLLIADQFFNEKLNEMFTKYNEYLGRQNLDHVTVTTDPSTEFTKQELNLLFTLFVAAGYGAHSMISTKIEITITQILKYSINGGNYSLAMRIKESPHLDQLDALKCILTFVENIPTLCANRIGEAEDFVISWEGGIVLSTWKRIIHKAIERQRLDLLLKLVVVMDDDGKESNNIDKVFKQVFKNRYLINHIFGHVRGIHRDRMIAYYDFTDADYIEYSMYHQRLNGVKYIYSHMRVYNDIGDTFYRHPIYSTIIKDRATDNNKGRAYSFFNYYRYGSSPSKVCRNPDIDVETFKQLVLLASPKMINPRNTSVMDWTRKSGNTARIQYLIDQGYKEKEKDKDKENQLVDATIVVVEEKDKDKEKELVDQVNKLKIEYKEIISKKYNQQSIDHYIQSRLKEMINHYRNYQNNIKNQNNNNKKEVILDLPLDEIYSWFTKQEIDLISKFLLEFEGLASIHVRPAIKKLLLLDNPIITTCFITLKPFNTKNQEYIVQCCSHLSFDTFKFAMNHLWADKVDIWVNDLLVYFITDSLKNGELVATRNVLLSGRLPINSLLRTILFLRPTYLDGYIRIALEFFSKKENDSTNKKFWAEILKIASWARPDIMDTYFSNDIINQTDISHMIDNSIKGGNYSMALKIKNTSTFDQLEMVVHIRQFVRAISTFCINRVSEAINFVIEWDGGKIILSNWRNLINDVLSRERFDILLKLVEVGIVSKNNSLDIETMVIQKTGFLLECMESLPPNCLNTSNLSTKRWKRLIRRAITVGSIVQVGMVVEKYFELGIDYDEKKKIQKWMILSKGNKT